MIYACFFLFFSSLIQKDFDCLFVGTPITELVAVRPKMYSYQFNIHNDDGVCVEKEKRTAKGIARCAIEKQLRHSHYKKCLFENEVTMNDMDLIRSESHVLYMNTVRKTGLSNFDDKRFWKNSINSLAYGHFKIPNVNKCSSVYF